MLSTSAALASITFSETPTVPTWTSVAGFDKNAHAAAVPRPPSGPDLVVQQPDRVQTSAEIPRQDLAKRFVQRVDRTVPQAAVCSTRLRPRPYGCLAHRMGLPSAFRQDAVIDAIEHREYRLVAVARRSMSSSRTLRPRTRSLVLKLLDLFEISESSGLPFLIMMPSSAAFWMILLFPARSETRIVDGCHLFGNDMFVGRGILRRRHMHTAL